MAYRLLHSARTTGRLLLPRNNFAVPVARLLESDFYFVASGDQSGVAPGWFAGGELH